jgi:hypothetical protein
MAADKKILDRVKKLLALAENNSNIHEAASAMASAEKMMRKYNLDRAEVMAANLKQDDLIEMMAERGKRRVPEWMGGLIVPVARAYDCEARYTWKNNVKYPEFLGQTEDATVASWVFQFLVDEVERLSRAYRRKLRKDMGAGHGVNMADYRQGLVNEIQITLRQMKEEKQEELRNHEAGKALVVVKNQLIAQKYNVTYSKRRQYRIRDASAYYQGRADGKKIQIRKTVTNGAAATKKIS